MKKLKLVSLIVAVLLISSVSCEEDKTDGVKLRIKKIADNIAMEDPWYIFEYDSEGRMIKEYTGDEPIEYDSNDRPIKIPPYTIVWSVSGFTQTHPDWSDRKEVCIVNSKKLLEKVINLEYNPVTLKYDTVKVMNYLWTGTTKLKMTCTYYPPYSEGNNNYEENYTFGIGNNPLKGIDVSMLYNSVGEWTEWIDPQNILLVTSYSENSFQATVVYELNDQNYPTRADITYTSIEGTDHDYIYFEYEEF